MTTVTIRISLTILLFLLISSIGADEVSAPTLAGDYETLWEQVIAHDESSKAASEMLLRSGKEAVPTLTEHLDDHYWKDRWDAVNLLGLIGEVQSTDSLLQRVIVDPNPHVRWRSLWALSALGNPAVPSLFSEELESRYDEFEMWNAVVGLAYFGQTESLPWLESGLIRNDSWQRWEAVYCLRRVHGENTSVLLVPLLDEPDERMRREVVMTLLHIGDERSNSTLLNLLDDADSQVRWRAAMGLARNQVIRAIQPLQDRLSIETDKMVRQHLNKAVESLTNDS